jgi:hypothetical protein
VNFVASTDPPICGGEKYLNSAATTVQYWYSNLSLTDTSVAAVRTLVLLQVFHIPFTHVSAFSMKQRTQNAIRILLHNMHSLGQLQTERQNGSDVMKVIASSSCGPTSVAAVRTSGFTTNFQYSVYPCLRLFHETPHP